jgi:hypothetical protein
MWQVWEVLEVNTGDLEDLGVDERIILKGISRSGIEKWT